MTEQILGPTIRMLWAILPILALVVVVRIIATSRTSAQSKGKAGEVTVSRSLRSTLPEALYTVLDDIYLALDDGTTTQIDHIVVSRYGVFVVETKNYSGWIFASEREATWTQSLYRRKFRFQNPIRQNYRHRCALAERLNVPVESVIGVVVFMDGCEFKTGMPRGVCYASRAAEHILGFKKPAIADKLVPEIIRAIWEWNDQVTPQMRRDHVANLNRTHAK